MRWAWTSGTSTTGKTTACRPGTSRSSTRSCGDTALRLSYIGTHGTDLEQKFEVNSRESEWNYQARTGLAVPGRRDDLRVNPDWAPRGTNHTGYLQQPLAAGGNRAALLERLGLPVVLHVHARAHHERRGRLHQRRRQHQRHRQRRRAQRSARSSSFWALPNLSYDERLRLGYHNSGDVPAHRIRWNAIYDLPFGKGKKFGNSASGVLNQVIGGWQLATHRKLAQRSVEERRFQPLPVRRPDAEQGPAPRDDLRRPPAAVFFRGDFNPEAATGVDQAALQQLVPADRGQRTLRPLNPDRGDNSLPQSSGRRLDSFDSHQRYRQLELPKLLPGRRLLERRSFRSSRRSTSPKT